MATQKIPKILHYIWLGGKQKPASVLACLESWKKYCPDYQLIEWNEERFGHGRSQIVDYALEQQNWAYAADVIRVVALEEMGGVYFDTDLELTAPIDDLLEYDAFLGYESRFWVGSAALGAVPHHPLYQTLVNRYKYEEDIKFLSNPFSVHAFSAVLRRHYHVKLDGQFKVIDGIALLPEPYFYPINYMSLKMHKTAETRGIHYYASSWHNKEQKRGARVAFVARKVLGRHIYGFFERLVANDFYRKISRQLKRIEHVHD